MQPKLENEPNRESFVERNSFRQTMGTVEESDHERLINYSHQPARETDEQNYGGQESDDEDRYQEFRDYGEQFSYGVLGGLMGSRR
jgi:hypothetical protein